MRRFLFKLLRAKPEDIAGETYSVMVDRQDKERLSFQKNCKHKKLSFRFPPLTICADCQKDLRYMTDEEKDMKASKFLSALKEAVEIEKQRA